MFRGMGLALLAAGSLAWIGPARGEIDVRPGLWEVSVSGMGDRKQTICLTPEMVRDMRKLSQRPDPSSDCRPSREKVSGNTRSFEVSCTRPVRYRAHISLTIAGPDRFSMKQDFTTEVNGRIQRGSLSMAYARIGECK
jgi:hypothetical protein